MRVAKAADHWRNAFRRPFNVQCKELVYEGLLGLGNGALTFGGGITAVVGGNGVGKSTLVAAGAELFGGEVAMRELDHAMRLKGSSLRGVITADGKDYEVAIAQNGNNRTRSGELPQEFEFAWLDPAYQTAMTRKLIAQDAHFEEVLEPIGPRKLNDEELEVMRYVVGKHYQSCDVYEVPEYGSVEQFPYFRVKADDAEYGSESMGQGELSLMFMMWELLTLSKNAVLLLEEPETHVSPRSQEALMNELARAAHEKAIWTVVTTHSPVVVSKIPLEHIRLLVRKGGAVSTIKGPPRYMLAAILGGDYGYRGAALVEDESAKQFLMALLEEKEPDLLRQFEIVDSSSNSGIASALRWMPKTRAWFSLIGVFDADQQGKVEKADEFKWPYTFLPGGKPQEQVLLEAAEKVSAPELAKTLGCNQETIAGAFAAIAGKDPHDQLHQFANLVGIGFDRLTRQLVALWLRLRDRSEDCKPLIEALRKAKESG